MRIIFIRHGEPNYEKDCLTQEGRRQAAACAERLKDEKITHIYTSPNGRARETASYHAALRGLELEVLPFMHEINWGSKDDSIPSDGHPWTLSMQMAQEQDITLADAAWREHPFYAENICRPYEDLINSGIDDVLRPFGYLRQGTRYYCEKGALDETIALVSHGGSGAYALAHLLNLSFPYVCAVLPYYFTSVTILRIENKPEACTLPQIELFNDCSHIIQNTPLDFKR